MIIWYHEISLLSQACVILVVNLILQSWNVDTYSCKHHLSTRFCIDCKSLPINVLWNMLGGTTTMIALPEADITLSNLTSLFKIKYVWDIILTVPDSHEWPFKSIPVLFLAGAVCPYYKWNQSCYLKRFLSSSSVYVSLQGVLSEMSGGKRKKSHFFFLNTVKYTGVRTQCIKDIILLIHTPFWVHDHWLYYVPPAGVCHQHHTSSFPWGLSGFPFNKKYWQLLSGGTKFLCGVNQWKSSEVNLALYKRRFSVQGHCMRFLEASSLLNSLVQLYIRYNFLLKMWLI